MNRPLISVVIPVHDGETYLSEAIESVLDQTYDPIEIVVVDDDSTDDSAHIARGYARREPSVSYLHQSRGGAGKARNRGVRNAEGDFLAFLDADDRWPKDKLTRQWAVFERNPGIDLVFGHVLQFISPELSKAQKREIRCPPDPMPGYQATTMLAPRPVFDRVGPFRTTVRVGEFIDWYLRAQELELEIVMLDDVVLWRRLHTTNLGRRRRDERVDYAHVLKAALDRRRSVGRSPPRTRSDTEP